MDQLTSTPSTLSASPRHGWQSTNFAATYLLVIAERINRSIIALLGAGADGHLRRADPGRGDPRHRLQHDRPADRHDDAGAISRRCGMFEYLAVWSAKAGRAQPWAILAMLSVVTAVVSAFLDNVTTVLLIAPVTLGDHP